MKERVIRIVLAILVGVLVGYSVAIGPGYYEQWQDTRALIADMQTNPAYKVIEAVEGYNPRITVLTVMVVEGRNNVAMWVLQDAAGLPQEEYPGYLVDALANMWQALVNFYPGRTNYIIIIGRILQVSTIEGAKIQIRGEALFVMDARAVRLFLDEPTEDSLDVLYAQGRFIFELIPQVVTVEKLLPREQGHIWPWGSGDDCPLPDDSCP